jgi:DNA-binding MarR family transcriptional regulator
MGKSKSKEQLPEEALEVADRLHSAAIHLLRRVRVRDRSLGIGPAQLSALSVLVFGGPRSLTELAAAEQVKPPTMSRIVASLVRGRLVRREPTEDRRKLRLAPTVRGQEILWEGRRRRVELLAEALERLPEAERVRAKDLAEFLAHLVAQI